jgi:hypothetical protein
MTKRTIKPSASRATIASASVSQGEFMTGEYIADDQLLVRRESVVAVRKSGNLQALTVWVARSATPIELVYPSQSERDDAYSWLVEELTT